MAIRYPDSACLYCLSVLPRWANSSRHSLEPPPNNTAEEVEEFSLERLESNIIPTMCTTGSPVDEPKPAFTHFLTPLYILASTAYTFGLHPIFYRQMAFPREKFSYRMNKIIPHDFVLDIRVGGLITGYDQWNTNVTLMTRMWRMAFKGCAFLVPVSLAFFQVSGVSNNIYARTAALSACLCASTGLVASNWYLLIKSSLRARRMRNKWIEASGSLKMKESIDFWVFLTLPISSLAWSICFSIATICIVIWTNTSDTSTSDLDGQIYLPTITSAVFLTALTITQTIQVYRGMMFFSGK